MGEAGQVHRLFVPLYPFGECPRCQAQEAGNRVTCHGVATPSEVRASVDSSHDWYAGKSEGLDMMHAYKRAVPDQASAHSLNGGEAVALTKSVLEPTREVQECMHAVRLARLAPIGAISGSSVEETPEETAVTASDGATPMASGCMLPPSGECTWGRYAVDKADAELLAKVDASQEAALSWYSM